jgi:hypothetical protein
LRSEETNVPIFPSDAWIAEFCVQLERHPGAGDMARALRGVYRFVVEPSGPVATEQRYDVEIAPDGDGARVVPLDDPVADPRLTIAAAYPRWVQLLRGELDLPIALMLRRIKVSGDLRAVTSNLDDARPLLDTLSAVDSSFPG